MPNVYASRMRLNPTLFLISLATFLALTNSSAISANGYGKTYPGHGCQNETPCKIGERSYQITLPDNWDEETPLPILLHFHGWGRQAHVVLRHKKIAGATRELGVLLIAPNGLGKSWDFWNDGSRDTIFANHILDDIDQRFPIDNEKIYISGYSWGGSMAWRYACESGSRITALLSISGTLYDQGEECSDGPVALHHVHGTKDTVMDYPYGPGGEITGPVELWRRINGCSNEPSGPTSWRAEGFNREFKHFAWTHCTSGKSVSLDVHNGGHFIANGWLKKKLKELLAMQ